MPNDEIKSTRVTLKKRAIAKDKKRNKKTIKELSIDHDVSFQVVRTSLNLVPGDWRLFF